MKRPLLIATALTAIISCTAPAQPASEAQGQSVVLNTSSGRPVVNAMINGHGPYPLIFDTGSDKIVMLHSVEQELGLQPMAQAPLGSPIGNRPPPLADIVQLSSLEVAGVRAQQTHAVAIDDGLVPLHGARGVVGPDAFPDRVFEIDVSGGTLWIGAAPRQQMTHWNSIGAGDNLEAQISVGSITIPAHIDSGSPGLITVPSQFASQLPLKGALRVNGGIRTIDSARLQSVGELGVDASISGVPVRLESMSFADIQVANIGMRALRGFTIVIDYPHRRWALVGQAVGPLRESTAALDFGAPMMPELDGNISVINVTPGSRAATAGLRQGDHITEVNGLAVATANVDQLREIFSAPDVRMNVERNGATLALSTHTPPH